jgi:ectoine hydroxylase-related dioxygenase (phytanoyl-CoA dioxygenase family)
MTDRKHDRLAHYREQGYCILERVIENDTLAALRAACDRLLADTQTRMERGSEPEREISRSGSRYFIGNRHREERAMRAFLHSELIAGICRELLGENAYLFCEQMVVKAAERGDSFAWHQDSGYVGFEHVPYLTLWCALDDATVENGTVAVLPTSRAGGALAEHVWSEDERAYVGYHDDDPGIPAIVPAGSIVAFSSLTFHRSASNRTDKPRRAYICQYSPEPILRPDTGQPKHWAVPILRDGVPVPVSDSAAAALAPL